MAGLSASMHLLAPRLLERPELSDQSVRREHRRRLCGGRRLPRVVQSGRIPVRAEFVERLRRDRSPRARARRVQPSAQVALRPEGGDVRSSEPDVVPEAASGNEEVDDALPADGAVDDRESDAVRPSRASGCRGGRRRGARGSRGRPTRSSRTIVRSRMVTTKSDVTPENGMRHQNAIGAGHENKTVLVGQRVQRPGHVGSSTPSVLRLALAVGAAGVAQRLDDGRSHLSLECVH